MAKQQFDPNDAKQLALEIEKIYKRMGQTSPFSRTEADLDKLREGLEDARDIFMDWEDGVGDIEKSFQAILNETNSINNSFNLSKRSLSSISSISSQLRDHQLGINQLSSKQLTTLKSKLDSETQSLNKNIQSLQTEKNELENKKYQGREEIARLARIAKLNTLISNTTGVLDRNNGLQKSLNKDLLTEINRRETIEKKLGVTGGILRGISKIPILGDLVDTNEALHIAESTIETTKSSVKGLGAAMGNLGKQAISGLLNPANLVLGAFTLMGKVLKDVDKGAGDFAKSTNITYSEALRVRGELEVIAGISGDVALNSKRLQETLGYVNQQLGTNGKLSEQDLIIFTKLREQSGLTNEQLFDMQKYTMATGGALEDNIATFQATSKILSYQNKVSINTKQLMMDMGNVSNRTKLSIEGGAEGLAKAAFNAKLMGGNLEKVAAIADQLLNFESSIEAELSAELLTGKNITLEKARQAALNNDLATVASEITNQIGSAAKYSEMNRIQQEAMAKAVGMNADQLADVLVEQEAIRAIGGKLSDDEQRAFETAKGRYGLEQASKMLKEGQLDQLVEQQSMQDRFNQSVEKLKDIFVSLAVPVLAILDPIANMVGWLAKFDTLIKSAAVSFATIKTIMVASELLQKRSLLLRAQDLIISAQIKANEIATAVAKMTGSGAVSFGITAAIGLAAGAAAYAYFNSIKDGEIDPKKGPILSGEFGSVQLDPRDKAMYGADGTIKVGTDLLKENTTRINPYTNNTQTSKQNPTADMSAMVNKIEQMFAKLQDRPVVVHSVVKTENNDVLASATNTSNRKTSYSIQ